MARSISAGETLSYAMGSFGTGVFSTVPAVLLLYFCTETLRISGSIAAGLILLPKIWSIVWDPLVGAMSDRSTNRWGRRRPFLVLGTIGMVASFVILFNVPSLVPLQTGVWVGVSYLALATFYSLFAVPYIAIPAEVSDDQTSLARMVSWRMVLVMIGILAGAAGAPALVAAGGGGRAGYGLMGWTIGVACLVVMLLPLIMLRGRDHPAVDTISLIRRYSWQADVVAVVSNCRFRRLALSYLAQATAFGAVSAGLPYVITKGLGKADSDIGTGLGVYLLATIIAVPVWSWAGRRFGMQLALRGAALSYAVSAFVIGALVLVHANWTTALLVLMIAGVPFAGLQVLPFTLAGDLIRSEAGDAAGCFTGVWTATEKLGLSLGPALVGIALSSAGRDVARGIGLFVCVIPPSLCMLSMLLLTARDSRSFV